MRANVAGVQWKVSPSEVAAKIQPMFADKLMAAIATLSQLMAGKVEAYAKAHAPWTDRTGNARQGLFTVCELSQDVITLYLSHTMDYGKWLELCNSGKYAIVMPALQAHYNEFMKAVKDLLK